MSWGKEGVGERGGEGGSGRWRGERVGGGKEQGDRRETVGRGEGDREGKERGKCERVVRGFE